MYSQDDYEPSQDVGESQLMLDHTVSRLRKAAEKANDNMMRYFTAGGDEDSQTSYMQEAVTIIGNKNGNMVGAGARQAHTSKPEKFDAENNTLDQKPSREQLENHLAQSKSDQEAELGHTETGRVQVKQEYASMPSNPMTLKEATNGEDSTGWQKYELLKENQRLKEALERSRERGMKWLQFYAALKAVEVEAERRYRDVATILEGLGYEVPEYPQRLGNEDIERETESWREIFTQRWKEMETAEEVMFLPKPTSKPVARQMDGRSKGLNQERERDTKLNRMNVLGEEDSSSSKRQRLHG